MGERRLLLVHAHPDDESIATGATMAWYAATGTRVTLLTCTLGEEGEILVPELAQLAAAQADQLGGLRIGELAEAMRALGVSDHRFLGGAGRFRDSGMMGSPANDHPRAFWRADADPAVFDAAVAEAVRVIREVRPQVMITYDDNGDYGHPDHIMAHRVATAAASAAPDPEYGAGEPWRVAKFYWTVSPTSALPRVITTAVDATESLDAKLAALRAHRTQIVVDGSCFALWDGLRREALGVEHFRLVRGNVAGEPDAEGRERDLFAGTQA